MRDSIAVPSTDRLEAKRHEQTPQALARLTVVGLFIVMWCFLWLLRIPMPAPFLAVLVAEAVFFFCYLRAVALIPSTRGIELAHYFMLAAEIVFHTTMVYFLGGISWLGAFAYVFGLFFTNTFLDLRRGFVYTTAAATAFISLALLEARGIVPHYVYLDLGAERYADGQFLTTTALGGAGVFFSIYLWVNWVGHQLRQERNSAVLMQDELLVARNMLEDRVRERTAELETANVALVAGRELLGATIESTADGILVVDRDGRVAHSNTRFLEMWHIPQEVAERGDDDELMGSVVSQLADPDAFVAKVRELYRTTREDLDMLTFRDGRMFERFSRPLMQDGEAGGRVWSFRDVTERKKAEELLRQQARHDALTSTLNHASITSILYERARTAPAAALAVVMVDVDGMKAVNDVYGHLVGDAALVAVASALQAQGAIVGRYGGDEFLVVLPGVSRADAEAYCHDVIGRLGNAQIHDPQTNATIPVVASAGCAMYPAEATSIEEVIRLADNAMYMAKRQRQATDGAPSRSALGDERAAKMVGELVPLLTSPGNLNDKLRLVAHQLSIGAGYDVVRFNTGQQSDETELISTFARVPDELVTAWNDAYRDHANGTVREVIARTRRPVLIDDIAHQERFSQTQRDVLQAAGIRAALIVPMIWQDEMIGILAVATKRERGLDARDVQFLTAVANQVTAIVQMETVVGELRAATTHLLAARADTVLLLAAAAEAHDQTTGRHLQRVRAISELLAAELGYGADEVAAIGLAAKLHDIGKIRVPETILLSPSQLTDRDWELMKMHTTWGAEFLAGRPGFELAATIASAHHERWDGTGYPRGLAGDQIPQTACIVAVADSLDAITNDRPYRSGRPIEWAVREIASCVGQQFSPVVVDALIRLHERDGLPLSDGDREDEEHAQAA